jgi:hypothetical protein
MRHADVFGGKWVRGLGDLTWVFWAENDKNKFRKGIRVIESVAWFLLGCSGVHPDLGR